MYPTNSRSPYKLSRTRNFLVDINHTVHFKNETNYRRVQTLVYDFLERPKTWPSILYNLIIFFLVFLCLIFSILSTIQEYENSFSQKSMYLEFFMLILFFSEYCIRTWSAGCRTRYQSWRGRFRFARKPFCVIDILIIITSIIILSVGSNNNGFAASVFRGLRFFQILRMIRIDRRGGSFKLLASVVWAHRQELFTTVYIGFLVLISSSFLIYLVEKKDNEKIRSYADALWWGVITLCTVGYGDTVPKSWAGKIIASFCALAGISFFALPAGILGSGFALKVQQHQRQKHLTRRRIPAAQLIQCMWRCCAISNDIDRKSATWRVFMERKKVSALRPSASFIESGRQRTNYARNFSLRLQRRNKIFSENLQETRHETEDLLKKISVKSFSRDSIVDSPEVHWKTVPNTPSLRKDEKDVYREMLTDNQYYTFRELTRPEEVAIQMILKTKFFVTRKRFKEALKPYDVKDVIEQYSAGSLDMLTRIKSLQVRLDYIIGDQDVLSINSASFPKDSMINRIAKLERRIKLIDRKLDTILCSVRGICERDIPREYDRRGSTDPIDLTPRFPESKKLLENLI